MVYFYPVEEGRVLTDAKAFLSNVLLVGKKENTGEVNREVLNLLPKGVYYHGVYDLADVLKEGEAYYFPEEELYLMRVETEGYPRFSLVEEGQVPSTFRILTREKLVDRISAAKQDKELKKLLSLEKYRTGDWKAELLKGAVVGVVFLIVSFFGQHYFEKQAQTTQEKLTELAVKKKELGKLYSKYRDKLYVLKRPIGKEGVEFLNKVERLPLSKVDSLVFAGTNWLAVGEVPYWSVKELKKKCREEKLRCSLSYKAGGVFNVRIER